MYPQQKFLFVAIIEENRRSCANLRLGNEFNRWTAKKCCIMI
jgi:hypothetical protein